MGGGTAKAEGAAPEDVGGHKFLGQVVEGFDPKGLRAAVDDDEETSRLRHWRADRRQRRPRQRRGGSHRRSRRPGQRGRAGQGGRRRARRPRRRRASRHGAGRRPRRVKSQGSARRRQATRWRRSRLDRHESAEPVTLNGACHCGAVQFTVTLTEGFASARRCTCSICRMRGAVAVTSTPDAFRITQGEDKLATYRFNTGTAEHHFCTVCGIYTHHKRRSNPQPARRQRRLPRRRIAVRFSRSDRVRRQPAPGRQCRAQDLCRRRAPVRARLPTA